MVPDRFDGYAAIIRPVAPAGIALVIIVIRLTTKSLPRVSAVKPTHHLGQLAPLGLKQFMGIDIETATLAIERLGL